MPNPDEAEGSVHLELSADEAVVLSDALSRMTETTSMSALDEATLAVLVRIEGQLEKRLVTPFSAQYAAILHAAQARVLLRWNGESPPAAS